MTTKKCKIALNGDCTLRFETIKPATIFRPLVDDIVCHCSFFKQKLEKSPSMDETFKNPLMTNIISKGDYENIKSKHRGQSEIVKQNPIIIKKYSATADTCDKKTYLSQLFEKCCNVLYKPHTVIPDKNGKMEDLLASVKLNSDIARDFYNTTYFSNELTLFKTPILNQFNPNDRTNIPIVFIYSDAEGQPQKLYFDVYSGPSTQFFTDVIKELLEYKVFIPTTTLFNNERYELNKSFDVSVLECYKILPTELKTPEFKKEIKEYFFLFVGNLIHFAVVNNIELPFKLSRVYIMKLFGLFDFLKDEADREKQILLISVYLLEKAPPTFAKTIIQIFEDPKNLLTEEVIQVLDPDLLEEEEEIKKGVRTNGYYTITNSNKHIYSSNNKKVVDNVVDYLYKLAFKHYFGDINSETPFNTMNTDLNMFFNGFTYVKQFDKPDDTKTFMSGFNFHKDVFSSKLNIIRKADLFLSGFGITHDDIKKILLPNIQLPLILNDATEGAIMSPLRFFNTDGVFRDSYIPNTSLNSITTNSKIEAITHGLSRERVKFMFLLYKALLNDGKDISKEFISQYNFKFYNVPYPNRVSNTTNYGKMTNEDYHNEFVKYLIKAWTGSPALSSNIIYTVDYSPGNFNTAGVPTSHTCFNTLHIHRDYGDNAEELYNDLVRFVTGTNFGELLIMGGKKSRKKR